MRHALRLSTILLLGSLAVLKAAPPEPAISTDGLLKEFVHPPVNFTPGEESNAEARKYQGIPTIERSPDGRLWAAWYAGPIHEDRFNYVMAATSDDDGATWSDLKFVINPDGDGPRRASDPCFWLDPNGKLWLFWWMNGGELNVTMSITTDNPDAETPTWTEPKPLFPGVMINKPIVTRNGEWLMPAAIWKQDDSCRVMVSEDQGCTWALRGAANVPEDRRNCDEPMLVERNDGSFWLLVRTANHGIGDSVSTDGGRTWTEVKDYLKQTTSRFNICRLASGNLLLVKHGKIDERTRGRTHLTAYLSDDDGKTWKGGLLLDERNTVSYPDSTQAHDGTIYVIYDWNRADDKHILMTTFNEEDVLAGEYRSDVARTRVLINHATGVNPKPWLKSKRPLSLKKNDDGAPLLAGPAAELKPVEGEIRAVQVGQPIFSNRKYLFHDQFPECLYNGRFVFSEMERTEAVCTQPGIVYVLTPTPERNKDSVTESLSQQGFVLAAVPEFVLFLMPDGRSIPGNVCSVYQRQVSVGDRIEFGKWGVLLVLPATDELRAESWHFHAAEPAHSTLTVQAPQAEFAAPTDATSGFTIKLTVDVEKFEGEKTILEVPDLLRVRLRQHDPLDRRRQNYPAFKMPDGSVPVLEANVTLHSSEHPDWRDMTVGIPLAMLKKPDGEHEVVLNFSGVRWTMYVDGKLLDNDFPFGYPQWAAKSTWKLDTESVRLATLYLPAITPTKESAPKPDVASVQYWTPPGHNCWVGDVATFFHKGRYHVFYLYDRRHHQSKFGRGAHYFEHLSTADLKTWTEHEAATPLEAQWECIGTGAPFVFDDKFCIGYGLHTERIYPDEKTTLPAQMAYLKAHGCTGPFDRSSPGAPIGSSYSISEDGMAHFKKTWNFFHPCRNPSVYRDPSGKLRMLANNRSKGMWESDSVDSGWRCISSDFPPGGDCTFFFRWGKFDYIIGGFKNLWSKRADSPDSEYEDVVAKGLDFYDGLNVPAITEISDGRFLMAGWTHIRGWGGNLVIRELIQFPDGRIGSKWLDEITPEVEEPVALAAQVAETATVPANVKSFLLSFQVQPVKANRGKCGISFLPENGEQTSCELQVRVDDRRAQFGPGSVNSFTGNQKSLREGGSPHGGGNYAIENLIGVDRPFTVRVIVKGDDKLGGSLIDAEIAGQRTMLSYRPDLTVKKLVFRTEDLELKNIQLAPLKN